MSYEVNGTSIKLTRGDSFVCKVNILQLIDPTGPDTDANKMPYVPREGDKARFAMKESYEDAEPLLIKDIPLDSCLLVLKPVDTKTLPFGKYVYDIELTKADGTVDTFIKKASFKLTEEVY